MKKMAAIGIWIGMLLWLATIILLAWVLVS